MKKYNNQVDEKWQSQYQSLTDYYTNNYDPKYFQFDQYELAIDPCESADDVERYDPRRQQQEIAKCMRSFSYFCHKYVKITHPKRGLLPFILYKYQRRVVDDFERNRFSIIRKFRQGGLTTVTVVWCLWRCLFKLDEIIMVVSKSDREAIAAGEIAKRAIDELPRWLQPDLEKNNDHQREFADTGCKLFFYTPEAVRGRAITYLIIDEGAFVPNMDRYWKALFPSISTGGNCICISTVNGCGNWYEETYHAAERGENDFHIIDLKYQEHPDYDDDAWVASTRAQLGEKGWLQEVMGDFLGAGETYIPSNIIIDYEQEAMKVVPARVLFPDWKSELARTGATSGRIERDPGALYIWREPIEGRDYVVGVDAAEGVGAEGDYSCFQVIDVASCEQVAEFYSNICPNHVFAQIIAQIGVVYNTACVIVENEKYGATVLSRLEHDLYYENLYQTVTGKQTKSGIKTTTANRPVFMDCMRTRLITKSIAIHSLRLIKEFKTFVNNSVTKKPEATKGFHDDAVLALSLALYARDTVYRVAPLGMEPESVNDRFKAEVFEEIRRELAKGRESWNVESDEDITSLLEIDTSDIPVSITDKYQRRFDSLLREFGF